jgi:hypothetical protein
MCTKIPKPKKPDAPPPPIEAPKIELETESAAHAVRRRQRNGRNQLRTGLTVPSGGPGLSGGLN